MTGGSVYRSGRLRTCPDRFNAAAYCLSADVDPAAEAFLAVDPERGVVARWTFADLKDRVLRAAGAFRAASVAPGDRVVLCLGDVPAFPVAYFGAIAAGSVATPLSSQLSEEETARIIASVAPRAVVGGAFATMTAEDLMAGAPSEIVPRAADDPALLVFTSGSSGRPKGVLHAQRAFWARQSMHRGWHDIRAGDRVMHAGAFNWTFTLGVGLADTWSVGGTAILNAGRRDPEVWPMLARAFEPTIFAGAPAVFRRILKYGTDLDAGFQSLRHAVTAGEALSPVIGEAWRAATGKPLLEALGMSEVSTFVSTAPDHLPEPGIAGWPQPGRHVAVLGEDACPTPFGEAGVLAVHRTDPGLMLRYWQDAAATEAACVGYWFLTGDRVRMRADGAITYLGRVDDQMNAQGYRVDPSEVEAALQGCCGVSECGVRALEVSDGLSVIGAWIVPEAGAALDKHVILDALSSRLADYKRPREVFLTTELPRTGNGKLVRRSLSVEGARRI
ncbi:MAG: AMP-binding protein [Pseudomonadota bacterium]